MGKNKDLFICLEIKKYKNYYYTHNSLGRGDIMGNKKAKIINMEDIMKYQIAVELGLEEKLKEVGWGGLTAKETGKIGGIITRKKKKMQKNKLFIID